MTLDEFIKIREDIRYALNDYNLINYNENYSNEIRCELQHKDFLDKKINFSIINNNETISEYNKLVALNTLTGVFDKCSPIEYILTKEFYKKLRITGHYKQLGKKGERSFLNKIHDIRDYLGGDYKIPKELFINQIKSTVNPIDVFNLENPIAIQIISDVENILLNSAIEFNKKLADQETVILARAMSKKEFESFQNDGVVSSLEYTGERFWQIGNRGTNEYYSFMVFGNEKDVLMNMSSVIPYLEERGNVDYFVMFRANVPQDEYFSAVYNRGTAKSMEIALPFYDSDNFEVLSVSEIDRDISYSTIIDMLKKCNVLSDLDVDNLHSEIFDRIKGNNSIEILYSNEELENMTLEQRREITKSLIYEIDNYYQELPIIEGEKVNCDKICLEALNYAQLMKKKYNLPDNIAYCAAGYIYQYHEKLNERYMDYRFKNIQEEKRYDENERVIEKICRYKSGKLESRDAYEYDTNGELLKHISYDSNNDIINTFEGIYDENRNRISAIFRDKKGDIISWEETEYNSTGQTTKSTYRSSEGSVKLLRECEYDTKGRYAKTTTYDANNNIIFRNLKEYDDPAPLQLQIKQQQER